MPTPVGHALAGLVVAWSLDAGRAAHQSPRADLAWSSLRGSEARLAAACALLAVVPDLDILFAVHRAAWHSLTAAAMVAAAAWAIAARRGRSHAGRVALACGLAWASHVGLDWLGRDSSPPHGVMALWPVSQTYFESGLGVFAEISRRYWKPDEFVWGNLRAVMRELAILLPVVALAWLWRENHSRSDFRSRHQNHSGSDFQ